MSYGDYTCSSARTLGDFMYARERIRPLAAHSSDTRARHTRTPVAALVTNLAAAWPAAWPAAPVPTAAAVGLHPRSTWRLLRRSEPSPAEQQPAAGSAAAGEGASLWPRAGRRGWRPAPGSSRGEARLARASMAAARREPAGRPHLRPAHAIEAAGEHADSRHAGIARGLRACGVRSLSDCLR